MSRFRLAARSSRAQAQGVADEDPHLDVGTDSPQQPTNMIRTVGAAQKWLMP